MATSNIPGDRILSALPAVLAAPNFPPAPLKGQVWRWWFIEDTTYYVEAKIQTVNSRSFYVRYMGLGRTERYLLDEYHDFLTNPLGDAAELSVAKTELLEGPRTRLSLVR